MGFDGSICDVLALPEGFCGICRKAEFGQKSRKTGMVPSCAHKIPNSFHGVPWEDHLKNRNLGFYESDLASGFDGMPKTVCDLMSNRV